MDQEPCDDLLGLSLYHTTPAVNDPEKGAF